MTLIDLFPSPKHVEHMDGAPVVLQGKHIQLSSDVTSPLIESARAVVEHAWAKTSVVDAADSGPWPVRLVIDDVGDYRGPEAYRLEITRNGAHLSAATDAGLFHGCQTFATLLDNTDGSLPHILIEDWPDLTYRGLYVESKWGPDKMELPDWCALIERMAELKLNALGIGVYGCWVVQYAGRRTEFSMLPFPDHPEIATPKTLRYYSPGRDAWVTDTYLPPMMEQDFFGEIVAYAKARNVVVRPHFNSPGHNTLLPRVFPEIASRDENGDPKQFGFCLSNPLTYDVIFELYDSVIDRYLVPHGIDWFHIGLDEVSGYAGIDESDPTRIVDPWCCCNECRATPHGRQLQDYAIRVSCHLKSKGINNITMWNDALQSLGALNTEFGKMITEAGLTGNVVVQWWRYHAPVLIPEPEIGLRAWSTAMAGYWSNLTIQSYTSNIYDMITNGARAGAEGADVYCIYDRANDRNYACLAQFAWNTESGEDLYEFTSRYAKSCVAGRLSDRRAIEAFSNFDQAFGTIAFTNHILGSLLLYWHTYTPARTRGEYPQSIIAALRKGDFRINPALAEAVHHARTARDLFHEAAAGSNGDLPEEYAAECGKLVGVVTCLNAIVRAVNAFEAGSRGNAETARLELATASEAIHTVMSDLERVKSAYLLPQILRDLSILVVYIEHVGNEMNAAGSGRTFASLPVNNLTLDRFVATEIVAD